MSRDETIVASISNVIENATNAPANGIESAATIQAPSSTEAKIEGNDPSYWSDKERNEITHEKWWVTVLRESSMQMAIGLAFAIWIWEAIENIKSRRNHRAFWKNYMEGKRAKPNVTGDSRLPDGGSGA